MNSPITYMFNLCNVGLCWNISDLDGKCFHVIKRNMKSAVEKYHKSKIKGGITI